MLAVAREIKKLQPDAVLAGVCEVGSKFAGLYEDEAAIDEVFQIPAGKYRRYGGRTLLQKAVDIETAALNIRDIFRTYHGYRQARKLIKEFKPDVMLVKGGFVAVPMGAAASRLGVKFLTHDSDSVPGLANRIISRWASLHATGMPAELYSYPSETTRYTGIPVSDDFVVVTNDLRKNYRQDLGIGHCKYVITIVGGSQGGDQLNRDMVEISGRLFEQFEGLGIIHIAGQAHQDKVQQIYNDLLPTEFATRVVVDGYVNDVHKRQGAADVVVTRAGATVTAELAVQSLPVVFVPGQLAGGHQAKNAEYFASHKAALVAPFGDAKALHSHIESILNDKKLADEMAGNLSKFAKVDAASQLAKLTIDLGKGA